MINDKINENTIREVIRPTERDKKKRKENKRISNINLRNTVVFNLFISIYLNNTQQFLTHLLAKYTFCRRKLRLFVKFVILNIAKI